MDNLLLRSLVIDLGIQWGCFAVAALMKTEKFYDLAGGSTFVLLAYHSLGWAGNLTVLQSVQTSMVMVWGLRLSLFLFVRVMKEGSDKRFNGIRENPMRFFEAWTLQGVWVFITLLPTLILNSKRTNRPPTIRVYVGWGTWVVGFLMEVIADYQKSKFRNNPENKGKFIQHGLWRICRHPNYLGEILLWTGLYVSASSALQGWEYISVASPILVTLLLTRVSGIPMLEEAGFKRWGSNPDYQAYCHNTPLLIPYLY